MHDLVTYVLLKTIVYGGVLLLILGLIMEIVG